MSIIRNEHGRVAHLPTINQVLRQRFGSLREFTVMQVMVAVNSQIPDPAERLNIQQIQAVMHRLTRIDDRVRRVALGRYAWAWAVVSQ